MTEEKRRLLIENTAEDMMPVTDLILLLFLNYQNNRYDKAIYN